MTEFVKFEEAKAEIKRGWGQNGWQTFEDTAEINNNNPNEALGPKPSSTCANDASESSNCESDSWLQNDMEATDQMSVNLTPSLVGRNPIEETATESPFS